MSQQTETRQTLAQAISNQFTSSTRPDGTSYTTAPDDSQARELVQHVHFSVFDGMLPNDWIYQKTREIVDLFAENDDELESAYELADIYTSDLIDWARYGTFRAFIDKDRIRSSTRRLGNTGRERITAAHTAPAR